MAPAEEIPVSRKGEHVATMWPGTFPLDLQTGKPLFAKCTNVRMSEGDYLHVPKHVVHAVVTCGPRFCVSMYSDVGMDDVAADTIVL